MRSADPLIALWLDRKACKRYEICRGLDVVTEAWDRLRLRWAIGINLTIPPPAEGFVSLVD